MHGFLVMQGVLVPEYHFLGGGSGMQDSINLTQHNKWFGGNWNPAPQRKINLSQTHCLPMSNEGVRRFESNILQMVRPGEGFFGSKQLNLEQRFKQFRLLSMPHNAL